MKFDQKFRKEIQSELDAFLTEQEKKFPEQDVLRMDLHCHDHNSDEPDELMGRILNLPETWETSEDLVAVLENHGCDTITVTNHNNARSCYQLREKGVDVVTGAEFSCTVPDYRVGIHVLAYGFTPAQEKDLYKLRSDIYKFQKYARENDIPTIWAHPMYHYKTTGMPSMDFFDKMALVFERFEVLNGQRDTWQNMLVKAWVESLTPERIDELSKKFKMPADRYCRDPYKKVMAGGSDSHMGIFAGLTGTQLYIPDLKEKLKIMSRSKLALEAIKNGDMAPFGSHNDSEKMTVTFLDYFCQVPMHLKDPGLLRILLHKGDAMRKLWSFGIVNGFAEITRHRVTMKFLKLFHECFTGNVPGLKTRLMVPRHYRPVFSEAMRMAETRRDDPHRMVETFEDSVFQIYTHLAELLVKRVSGKLEKLAQENDFKSLSMDRIMDHLELPGILRTYMDTSRNKKGNGNGSIDLTEFLDGLPFPALASAVIVGASFASAKVLYNNRPLLDSFAEQLGKLRHPHRALWLTDTFEDSNGVAMVLRSMLDEIQKRDLPIDLLVCSSTLEPEDHLVVIRPMSEFTMPFYEHQPVRVPNILEIHRLFKQGEYDRVICSTEGPMGFISLFLKQAYSVPAHFYVHTDWMMFARKVLNFDQQNLGRMRRLLRAFYRGFDSLFVLNTDQQKWLTSSAMGFPKSRVHLTAHWAEEFFKPKKVSKHKIFGTRNGDVVLLFAGRVSAEKGVMEIPAIYRKVRETCPHVKVAIAGKGPAEKALKEAMPDGIFLGWVDHDKLPEIYSAADLLILPSRFDTFGCVVLEALSCGLPVAAYKTKGPRDIIRDRKNGYLVRNRQELVNAVLDYISSKKKQETFRKAALERAAQYDANLIIRQFVQDVEMARQVQ